jgi:hypothetical protein
MTSVARGTCCGVQNSNAARICRRIILPSQVHMRLA